MAKNAMSEREEARDQTITKHNRQLFVFCCVVIVIVAQYLYSVQDVEA